MERVKVTIFTDPGCPFGFNAQRQETQLEWHYGDGLDITRRMIRARREERFIRGDRAEPRDGRRQRQL